MTNEEVEAFINTYVLYRRWNRLPAELPTSKADGEAFIAKFTAHAAKNPYVDDVYDLFDLIHHDPASAWELVRRIISAVAENDGDLEMFGAGDLETFVRVQAVPFADQIESEIRRSAAFRKAFESVYMGESTPPHIGRRFNAALRDSGVPEEFIIDWWSSE